MTAVVIFTTKKTPTDSHGHEIGIGVAQVVSVVAVAHDTMNPAITDITLTSTDVLQIGDTFANVVSALNA